MSITRPSPSILSGVAWSVPVTACMPGMIGLRPGDLIQTAGYHSAGDGGGATYRVVAAGTGIVDGGEFINLPASGTQARAQFGGAPDPRQFGARTDGATDDRLALQRWIDYIGARAVAFTGLSGPMIICDLGGGVFGVAGTLNLSLSRGAILRNGTFVAVGADWGGGELHACCLVSRRYPRLPESGRRRGRRDRRAAYPRRTAWRAAAPAGTGSTGKRRIVSLHLIAAVFSLLGLTKGARA